MEGHRQLRFGALLVSTERATRLVTIDTGHRRERANTRSGGVATAGKVLVNGPELDRGSGREAGDDLVDVGRAEVLASRRRQGDGARPVVRNDALRRKERLDAAIDRAGIAIFAVRGEMLALPGGLDAKIVGADLTIVAADRLVDAGSGCRIAGIGRTRIAVIATCRSAVGASGDHANRRRRAPGHSTEVATRLSNELDLIGDVEVAVDRPIVSGELCECRVARAREAEPRTSGDPQEIEIGIADWELTPKPEHIGRKLLNRRSVHPRPDVRFEADRQLNDAVPSRKSSRSLKLQLQRRVRAFLASTEGATRLIAVRRRQEVANPRRRSVAPAVAHEVTVNPRELDRGTRWKPVDDLVNVGRTEVTAAGRRQGHRARPVIRDDARRSERVRREQRECGKKNDTHHHRKLLFHSAPRSVRCGIFRIDSCLRDYRSVVNLFDP